MPKVSTQPNEEIVPTVIYGFSVFIFSILPSLFATVYTARFVYQAIGRFSGIEDVSLHNPNNGRKVFFGDGTPVEEVVPFGIECLAIPVGIIVFVLTLCLVAKVIVFFRILNDGSALLKFPNYLKGILKKSLGRRSASKDNKKVKP